MKFFGSGLAATAGLLLALTTIVDPVFGLPQVARRTVGTNEKRAFGEPRQVPTYNGPKDNEKVPTYEGIKEFALATWPEDLDEKYDMMFWTGMDIDREVAANFLESREVKTIWFEDIFPLQEAGRRVPKIIWDVNGVSGANEFMKFARPSGVYAELAQGTIYVLVPASVKDILDPYPGPPPPEGQSRGPNNGRAANFALFELPILTRNAEVRSIRRVDPADFNSQSVIWTKGDAPMGAYPDFNDYTPRTWPSAGQVVSEQTPADSGNNDV